MTMVGCIWMMAAYAQGPMVRLGNGVEMPQFGIGTFNVPSNEACKDAVLTALRAGYRHIDTAHAYMDERGVGDAVNEFIAEGGCKREDIWVTSKIWPSPMERDCQFLQNKLLVQRLAQGQSQHPIRPVFHRRQPSCTHCSQKPFG